MSEELRDLYQKLVIDHARRPRNFCRPQGTGRTAEGNNPLCGDRIAIHLVLAGEMVEEIGFTGEGCAISIASASLMTCAMKNKTRAEAEALFERVQAMFAGSGQPDGMGDLAAFSGVRQFPARVKCAALAWHALRSALRGESAVSTE